MVAAFGVRLSLFQEAIECTAGVLELSCLKVSAPDLAPDLVLAVLDVASHDRLEMCDSFRHIAPFARHSTQLIVSIGFVRVDVDRSLKTDSCVLQLAVSLVNQAEVIVGGRVRRVER